jgi:Na+/H+ antiporter NhaC
MATFTFVHVLLSLVGIGSGLLVVAGLLNSKEFARWTQVFLATTLLTSVTGFFFPFHGFTPGIGVGILSIIILAIAIVARYIGRLAGAWRKGYVVTAVMALYFNVFVLVVQLFEKVPALQAIAPTQTELPFAATQIVVLALFVGLGIQATRRFHSAPPPAARAAAGGSR